MADTYLVTDETEFLGSAIRTDKGWAKRRAFRSSFNV